MFIIRTPKSRRRASLREQIDSFTSQRVAARQELRKTVRQLAAAKTTGNEQDVLLAHIDYVRARKRLEVIDQSLKVLNFRLEGL